MVHTQHANNYTHQCFSEIFLYPQHLQNFNAKKKLPVTKGTVYKYYAVEELKSSFPDISSQLHVAASHMNTHVHVVALSCSNSRYSAHLFVTTLNTDVSHVKQLTHVIYYASCAYMYLLVGLWPPEQPAVIEGGGALQLMHGILCQLDLTGEGRGHKGHCVLPLFSWWHILVVQSRHLDIFLEGKRGGGREWGMEGGEGALENPQWEKDERCCYLPQDSVISP